MNTEINLTLSQKEAIEKQKRIFLMVYPDAKFSVYTPHNIPIVRLIAEYEIDNLAGGKNRKTQAWTIGKRGKVR